MTAQELQELGSQAEQDTALVQGMADQATLAGIVATSATEGQDLVARIHDRKRLTLALEAADAAYTVAVQAAVGRHGDWAHVRQAGEVVRQARSALKEASK